MHAVQALLKLLDARDVMARRFPQGAFEQEAPPLQCQYAGEKRAYRVRLRRWRFAGRS